MTKKDVGSILAQLGIIGLLLCLLITVGTIASGMVDPDLAKKLLWFLYITFPVSLIMLILGIGLRRSTSEAESEQPSQQSTDEPTDDASGQSTSQPPDEPTDEP